MKREREGGRQREGDRGRERERENKACTIHYAMQLSPALTMGCQENEGRRKREECPRPRLSLSGPMSSVCWLGGTEGRNAGTQGRVVEVMCDE